MMSFVRRLNINFRDGEYNNPKAREEIANVEDGYMYLLKKYRKI